LKWTRFLCVCFLLLLTLSVTESSLLKPFNFLIHSVYGVTLPGDGDAWTENDNATYPWKPYSPYPEQLEFITSDKYVGSYSFRIKHTSSWDRMRWYLEFGENDVSGYDALQFWIKPVFLGSEKSIVVYIENSFMSNPRFYVKFKPTNNSWSKVYLPLDGFIESGTNPTWTDRKILHFYISDNIGASDGTTVHIDGLSFTTHTDSSPNNSLDGTFLPNFYRSFVNYAEKENIVYNSTSYTSLYDWINYTSGEDIEGNLEAESLGQAIGLLGYLYKEMPSQTYLNKAETYANWLLEFQDVDGTGNGIVYNYNNALGTFDDKVGTTVNGWCLWGMSVLHNITGGSSYKTFSDKLMEFLIDDDWMWNSTHNQWDKYYDKVDGWTYATAVSNAWSMRSGAAITGLAAYYRYVDSNTTVKDRIQTFYDNVGVEPNNELQMGIKTEDTMYNAWGMYEAWQAFSNTTYKDEMLDVVPQYFHAYQEIYSNASITNYAMLCNVDSWDHLSGWGASFGLPLLMISYETSASTFKQKAFEKFVFDWISNYKGDAWAIEYTPNSPTRIDQSWVPTQLAIHLALVKYYKSFITDPYILLTDGEIKSSTYASDRLSLKISGTGTTMTQVYVGNKSKPLAVLVNSTQQIEGTTWTYNGTLDEVTITLNHTTSTLDVKLSWSIHSLVVDVFRNSIPTNANISLFDAYMTEIETIQNVTSHEWLLPEGKYYSQAFITYEGYPYSSDLFEVNLIDFARLAINFQFNNLTVLVTDIQNQPLENALVTFDSGDVWLCGYSNKSGLVTIEVYSGNWIIEVILWFKVGESKITINDANAELTIKSNVGNVTINITDQYGKPIKSNVTLTNPKYSWAPFSGVLNGTATTITFTQIPLVNYTLTVESKYGTQTYTIDTSQNRQIKIEIANQATKGGEETTYFLIGTLAVALVIASIILIFIKRRRKAKPTSTTQRVLLPQNKYFHLIY